MKIVAIVLAIVFAVIAICYWVGVPALGKHTKHGVLFAILAILSLIWLRFQAAQPARR